MNYSFNRLSLSRLFYPEDFYKHPNLSKSDFRDAYLDSILNKVLDESLFDDHINTISRNGKSAYNISDLKRKLLLRRLSENIKRANKIKIKPRNKIVKELREVFREESSFRVYRLDIKNFFESCCVDDVMDRVSSLDVGGKSVGLCQNLMNSFSKISKGIPRGIEVSPILSELVLQEFDEKIKSSSFVFYYSRYVDDIIIVTSMEEDKDLFKNIIEESLPEYLSLNYSSGKFDVIDFNKKNKNDVLKSIDYIGYKFKIETVIDNENSISRVVTLDLSDKTIHKIKTRISRSIYSLSKNRDVNLFIDRIKFLTSNRALRKSRNNYESNILTGIYYSYSLLDFPSNGLQSLDAFLWGSMNSNKSRISKVANRILSSSVKSEASKYSFKKGFLNRHFIRFSPNRLEEICRIWL